MTTYRHTYIFPILESENYDGDSFNLTLDIGFNLITHRACRLQGIDTPELRGGTRETKAAGHLARIVARDWVERAMQKSRAFFKSTTYAGKFGRPLGDIIREHDGASLVQMLINNHLGVSYKGQAKSLISADHAANLKFLLDNGYLLPAEFDELSKK